MLFTTAHYKIQNQKLFSINRNVQIWRYAQALVIISLFLAANFIKGKKLKKIENSSLLYLKGVRFVQKKEAKCIRQKVWFAQLVAG